MNEPLFTNLYELEEAYISGLIDLDTYLNEYKRLTEGENKA